MIGIPIRQFLMLCAFDDSQYPEPRLFPYGPGPSPNQIGFIDFKAHPELIELTLEDFIPYQNEKAVQTFYQFLRWINGSDSPLETSDCVFRYDSFLHDDKRQRFTTHGRVYILWRDLALNADMRCKWLCEQLMTALFEVEPDMEQEEGAIFFSAEPVIQMELSHGDWFDGQFIVASDDPGHARHLQLSFRSYGNSHDQVFKNMDRVFNNLLTASKKVAEIWKAENAGTK